MKIGDKAPNFTLPDKSGKNVSLSDYKGRKVILYFYPKDNTPGCTKQACNFRDNYPQIVARGAEVIGISKDGVKSHSNFAEKYELPFVLLSDKDMEVIKMYEVWKEKKMFGKTSMGVVRTTFLIDEDGKILDIIDGKRMKSTTNADDVIKTGFLE